MNRKKSILNFGNSILFGRLWIGSKYDSFMIVFVLGSYAILQTYYFYLFSQDYNIESDLNILSTILFTYNFLSGTFTEPGVIKKQTIEDEQTDESNQEDIQQKSNPYAYFQERYCSKCKIMRPPKASHCYQCKNCVKSYDHHCNFMANCIGERNYKYFIGWVYSLVFQCTIWYITLIQHFYYTFSFHALFKSIDTSLGVQMAIVGFIVSCCCAYGCVFARNMRCFAVLGILTNIILFLYFSYDASKTYYENYICSLIFFILTIPGAIFATEVSVVQTFHLSIGINQKEWSVMQKNQFRQIHDSQPQELQTMKEEIETEEEKELKNQISVEISQNEQLRDKISPEQIDYIYNQKKLFDRKQRENQINQQNNPPPKQAAGMRAYIQNVTKLLLEKTPQSELY